MGTEEPTPIALSIDLFSTKLQLDQKTMTLNRSTWERFGGRSAKRHWRKMKPGCNCEVHNVRDWQTTPTGRLCSVESTYPIMCILKDRHFSSLELGFNVPIHTYNVSKKSQSILFPFLLPR